MKSKSDFPESISKEVDERVAHYFERFGSSRARAKIEATLDFLKWIRPKSPRERSTLNKLVAAIRFNLLKKKGAL